MKKIDPKDLRKRFIFSLATGLLMSAILVSTFLHVRNGPEKEGTPIFLRSMLSFNEGLWSRLSSNTRLSVKKNPPQKGTSPRVNGDIGLEEDVDTEHYQIQVESGERKLSLPVSAFQALPKVGYTTDFRCIEGWSEVIQYGGGRFSEFMQQYQLGKKNDGSYYRYVGFETPDSKYYVSIDMDSMLHPQTVLAYEMNEVPLNEENGAPLRLIIPIKYGIKHIKRIGKISFSDTRPHDYWEERGYDWWAGL